jgi:hypothetical protein
MADNTRRGGVLKFTLAGVAYEVEASITIQPYKFQRESVQGVTGPSGHKRTAIQPKITAAVFKRSDQPMSFLRDLVNARVTVTTYEGTQWIMTRGTRVSEMPLDAAEGTFELEIDSPDEIQEIPATA